MKKLIYYTPLFLILTFNIISGIDNEFYIGVILNVLLLMLMMFILHNKFFK